MVLMLVSYTRVHNSRPPKAPTTGLSLCAYDRSFLCMAWPPLCAFLTLESSIEESRYHHDFQMERLGWFNIQSSPHGKYFTEILKILSFIAVQLSVYR